MRTTNLLNRVEILERKVSALAELPARVDALTVQIVQLRQELRDEFSAVRTEIRAGDEETRALMRAGDEETRTFMRALDEETRALMRAGDEETRALMRTLNEETRALMQTLNEETRAHMLVLHEDVIERIGRLGEAWIPAGPVPPGRPRARRNRRPPRRKR